MLAVYIGLRALPRQDWAVPIVVREAELGAPSYLPRIAIGQRSRMGLNQELLSASRQSAEMEALQRAPFALRSALTNA